MIQFDGILQRGPAPVCYVSARYNSVPTGDITANSVVSFGTIVPFECAP